MVINKNFEASGINWSYYESLPKSKNSESIACEYAGVFGYIPTLLSTCPKCENKVKWRTTGIIPMSLKCENCETEFRP